MPFEIDLSVQFRECKIFPIYTIATCTLSIDKNAANRWHPHCFFLNAIINNKDNRNMISKHSRNVRQEHSRLYAKASIYARFQINGILNPSRPLNHSWLSL